jgi:hypothetical protein
MRCRGLHEFADLPYLSGFLFAGFLCVAPYCVPGGIRVVSNCPVRVLFSVACLCVLLAKLYPPL